MTIFHKFTMVKDGQEINSFEIIDSETFNPEFFPSYLDGFMVRYDGVVEINIGEE